MKPSARHSIPALLLVAAALLSGCGRQAPSVTAPGVGQIAGVKINTDEGPFGGQTVAWYTAQLNSHALVAAASDPAWQEALWCSGKDAQGNAAASADAVTKRRGTVSCHNLYAGADQAQGPYARRDHAWFKAHPKEHTIQGAWCQAMGDGGLGATGACAAVETTGAGFY
ncbi:hypothetical protein [Thiomonas sp.]